MRFTGCHWTTDSANINSNDYLADEDRLRCSPPGYKVSGPFQKPATTDFYLESAPLPGEHVNGARSPLATQPARRETPFDSDSLWSDANGIN